MPLPRYTQVRTTIGGENVYRFNPPSKLIELGVSERVTLGTDKQHAIKTANILNIKIDEYYIKEKANMVELTEKSTLLRVIDDYYGSHAWENLKPKTQDDYKYCLTIACKTLGRYKLKDISTKLAKKHYQEWLKRGVSFANHITTTVSIVFNYAVEMEITHINPFARIKRTTALKRTDIWTKLEVEHLLDDAYNHWKTRNIGLIIHMAYAFCQRMGDMRMLEWQSFNQDLSVLYLQQSKRRAKVELPVDDELKQMLQKQQEDFGFQKYVAPNIKPINGVYEPYTLHNLSMQGRRLMDRNNISSNLRLMDLRRTGIMEMVDGGVPLPQIMAVSGHSNPQSVKPYMKNTYSSANSALTTRKNHVDFVLKQREGV